MKIETMTRKLHAALSECIPDFEITEKSAAETPKGKACLCISRPGLPAAMMIYPEDYADQFRSPASIRKLAEAIAGRTDTLFEISEVVSSASLQDSEKLDAVPAYKDMDLSHIPHYSVPGTDISLIARLVLGRSEGSELSYLVTDAQISFFECSGEEVLQKALENTEKNESYIIAPLAQKLCELYDADGLAESMQEICADDKLWIVTNRKAFNGASAIAYPKILRQIYEKIGEPYYILPSSRHELLVLGISCTPEDMSRRELPELVSFVNTTQVASKDQLSDSVFLFDGETLRTVEPDD